MKIGYRIQGLTNATHNGNDSFMNHTYIHTYIIQHPTVHTNEKEYMD